MSPSTYLLEVLCAQVRVNGATRLSAIPVLNLKGVGFAQVAAILAVLKLFPGGQP